MINIAFKRAKNAPMVKDSLHPDFIVEYADTTKFEEGFHKSEDGYEILSQDLFDVEFSLNAKRHDEFLEKKRQEDLSRQKANEAVAAKEAAQQRKDKREYDEFLRWKNLKNNQEPT